MMRYMLPLLVLVWPAFAQQAAGPSFDCTRARAWDERTICAFADLAALDRQIAEAWRSLMERLPADDRTRLQGEQRAWLAERRGCEGPVAREALSCLRRALRARARDLTALAAAGTGSSASSAVSPLAKPPPADAAPPAALRAADCARPAGWAATRICAVPGMRELDAAVVRDVEAARAHFARQPAALAGIEAAIPRYLAEREACAGAAGRVPVDCLQETMEDMRAALRQRMTRP